MARRRETRGSEATPPPPLGVQGEVEEEEEETGGEQGFRGTGECSEENDEGEEEDLR